MLRRAIDTACIVGLPILILFLAACLFTPDLIPGATP